MLSREVHIDRVSEVRDSCCDHVRWPVRQEAFVTEFAAVALVVFNNLAAAVVAHASSIENLFIVLDARDVAIEEEEMEAVRVIFSVEGLVDLADHV